MADLSRFVTGALQTGLAAANGLLEAEILIRQAQTEQERQRALALREERKIAFEQAMEQRKVEVDEERNRIAEEQNQRIDQFKRDKAEFDARQALRETTDQAARDVAAADLEHSREIELQENRARLQDESANRAAQREIRVEEELLKLKSQQSALQQKIDEREAVFKRPLTEDELRFLAFGKDFETAEKVLGEKLSDTIQLNEDQRKAKNELASRLAKEKSYGELFEVRAGYNTALTGFEQNNGFGDIAMVNGYQRMIDPGATVREGDITTLASGVSAIQNLFNITGRIVEGDRFTDEVRGILMNAVNAQYTRRINDFNDTTRKRYETDIASNPILAGIITYDNIGDVFTLPTTANNTATGNALNTSGLQVISPSANQVQGPQVPQSPMSQDEVNRRLIEGR